MALHPGQPSYKKCETTEILNSFHNPKYLDWKKKKKEKIFFLKKNLCGSEWETPYRSRKYHVVD